VRLKIEIGIGVGQTLFSLIYLREKIYDSLGLGGDLGCKNARLNNQNTHLWNLTN
jgi:hypothetical protein